MAEQSRARLANAPDGAQGMPTFTARFAVAGLDPDVSCAEAWVKCGDLALYASRNGGRNRVTSNGPLAGVDVPAGIMPLADKIVVKKPAGTARC